MGLRFTWQDGITWERKSSSVTLSPRVQQLLEEGPLAFDGQVGLFETFSRTYAQMYRTQSALRAVVDFLSRNISQCRVRLFGPGPDGVARLAPDHPVQRVLEHPQRGVPRSRLMRQVVADRAIYDVAAVWKVREDFDPTPDTFTRRVRNRGEVRDLVRIPVPLITITDGSFTQPIEFRVMGGRQPIAIPSEDLIWMPGYSPTSSIIGTPPIETLRQILAEEFAAGKDRENYWKHGPQMSLVFLQDELASMSEDQFTRFKEQWQARYGGVGASHAREVPIIPRGLKPHEIAINAQSAEYLATRKLARIEVCVAYGIQPQLLGLEPSNFASMDMFHQMLYQDALAPWMVSIQEELEEQLLREFEDEDSGFFLDFNINAKLQGSFLDQAKIGQQAVGGPWMTRNEFREKFQGLPPVEGGDEIIIPMNVILAGGPQANPQDATNQFSAEVIDLRDQQHRQRLRQIVEGFEGVQ